MEKRVIVILLITFLCSCKSTNVIQGKTFRAKSYKREIILSFGNDSTFNLTNIFHCKDIKNEYQTITIKGFYKKLNKEKILIRNIECKDSNCIFPPTIEIPPQESTDCDFFNIEKRKDRRIFDGRRVTSEFNKYGLIPNIDIDTLFTIKNKVYLIKQMVKEGRSVGFILK